MNGTHDGHDASGTTNERLDQLLSLRQDGALDARETAELDRLLSANGPAGERARARARAFAVVDERLHRLAAQAIPPARLAGGLAAIEQRLPLQTRTPKRSISRRGWLGLGLGLAAAAALAFALLVMPRRDVDETPAAPSLAASDVTPPEVTATSDAPTHENDATTSDATTVAAADAKADVLPDAETDGVDVTIDPRDDRSGDAVSADEIAGLAFDDPADHSSDPAADPAADRAAGDAVGSSAEELASLGLEDASDLEVIEKLELLDFLASRDAALKGPRG